MVSGHMSQGDLNSNLLPNPTFPIGNWKKRKNNSPQKKIQKKSKKIKKNKKNQKKSKKIKGTLTRIYYPILLFLL